MLKRFFPPALFAFSTLVLLLAPTQPVAASECGETGSYVCAETEKCRGWLWWKKCKITDTEYWHGL